MRELTNEDHHLAHFATWVAMLVSIVALVLAATNYFAIQKIDDVNHKLDLLIDQTDQRLDSLESDTMVLKGNYLMLQDQELSVENSATIVNDNLSEDLQ